MPLSPFLREDFGGTTGGVADVDSGTIFPEDNLVLPWGLDPSTSWIDYRCWVEISLDPGTALHKVLPQTDGPVDTLASVAFADAAPQAGYDSAVGGPVVASANQWVDAVYRMATPEYRFVLTGWGLRAGYKIPIPGLVSVGKAPAIPEGRQVGYNVLVGNFSGVPTWFAYWSLPYVIATSPGLGAVDPIPPNPALHVRGDAELPRGIALPRGPVDGKSTGQSILRGRPLGGGRL